MRLSLGFLLLLATVGCVSDEASVWRSEVVMTAEHKLGGCAVGDLHPGQPGNEIAAVSVTGEVFLARRTEDGWQHDVIARAGGELIQCAIGDADPARPGTELLVFGMKTGTEDDGGRGAAHIVYREESSWQLETVFEDSALIHAGCIVDLDPSHPGPEIVLAGYGLGVYVVHKEGGHWKSERAADLTGPAKCTRGFRGGAAIGCADGKLLFLSRRLDSWSLELIDHAPAGQSRLGGTGERLLVARDDGELALIEDGERTEIYAETDKLRGAVLADLDPRRPGLEAATAGYGQTITVLVNTGEFWKAETVFTDDRKLHHLTSGEVLADSPGVEAVGCGYSGKLIVIGRAPY